MLIFWSFLYEFFFSSKLRIKTTKLMPPNTAIKYDVVGGIIICFKKETIRNIIVTVVRLNE